MVILFTVGLGVLQIALFPFPPIFAHFISLSPSAAKWLFLFWCALCIAIWAKLFVPLIVKMCEEAKQKCYYKPAECVLNEIQPTRENMHTELDIMKCLF